jgi:hypothetical protein
LNLSIESHSTIRARASEVSPRESLILIPLISSETLSFSSFVNGSGISLFSIFGSTITEAGAHDSRDSDVVDSSWMVRTGSFCNSSNTVDFLFGLIIFFILTTKVAKL